MLHPCVFHTLRLQVNKCLSIKGAEDTINKPFAFEISTNNDSMFFIAESEKVRQAGREFRTGQGLTGWRVVVRGMLGSVKEGKGRGCVPGCVWDAVEAMPARWQQGGWMGLVMALSCETVGCARQGWR